MTIVKALQREQFLAIALRMFKTGGPSSLSRASLARESGYSLATIKRQFANRDILFQELFKYAKEIGDEEVTKLADRLTHCAKIDTNG